MYRATFENGSPPVLHLMGEIDLATCDDLRRALESALRADRKVIVDMGEVTFIDASGLRVILSVSESLNGSGPLKLINASRVARLLELVGLSELPCIDVHDASDDHAR